MIHAHDFVAQRRRAPLPRLADAHPLTPADYIRLRRENAGLSERQLAARLTHLYHAERPNVPVTRPIDDHMLHVVKALELPGAVARVRATIEAVAAVMPLDVDVYFQLAGPARRHPRVCRGCGCSAHDACQHDDWGSCHWVSPTQCNHCAARAEGR